MIRAHTLPLGSHKDRSTRQAVSKARPPDTKSFATLQYFAYLFTFYLHTCIYVLLCICVWMPLQAPSPPWPPQYMQEHKNWPIHMRHDAFACVMTHRCRINDMRYIKQQKKEEPWWARRWMQRVHACHCDSDINASGHIWMRQVTGEWVMSHMNESSHIWMSHATYECDMSRMNEAYHVWLIHDTYGWVMSHMH